MALMHMTIAGQVSSCTVCPVGTFQSEAGKSYCTNCPPGRFRDALDPPNTCKACSAGRFAASSGQTSCDVCPAGRHSPGEAEDKCTSCAAGTYSPAGSGVCFECGDAYFSGFEADRCIGCPVGSRSYPSSNNSVCECDAKLFAISFRDAKRQSALLGSSNRNYFYPQDTSAGFYCQACAEGHQCGNRIGLTVADLQTKSGFMPDLSGKWWLPHLCLYVCAFSSSVIFVVSTQNRIIAPASSAHYLFVLSY